ncbi:diguanylate cyclase [Clostridium sp. D33t1_170424_F3]|uniref:GGDEF domain-containing protein n=1 Tax=Clostridium sp. D33t1_170424_F3 TaxID=2787099 RepID=UPI0018AAD2CF|nr:diguanylate cyclase [Clostridium sp. D33t1_170424_F3]
MKTNGFIGNMYRRSADYFTHYREDITNNNFIILRKAGIIYLLLLTFYAVLSTFMFRNTTLLSCYVVFWVLSVAFVIVARNCYIKHRKSYRAMQTLCMLFIVLVMAFIIVISVFPYPTKPSIFFPIMYLVMTVLFVFPMWKTNLLLSAIEAVFVVLVLLFKTPDGYSYDIFASVTAWVIGFAFTYLILDLRLRENDVRRELERISLIDEITGLSNRRDFNRYIAQTYAECRRKKQPIALFMMDIDHFKDYNDDYGHLAGDACLSLLGQALHDVFAENDIYISRYGGEEFTLVLVGRQVRQTEQIVEEIMDCVRQCAIERKGSATGYITISIGVAQDACPQKESYIDLIQQADTALYYAKENGRNCAAYYHEEMGLKKKTGSPVTGLHQ